MAASTRAQFPNASDSKRLEVSEDRHRSFWEHARQAEDQLSSVRDFVRWGGSRLREAGLCYGHGYEDAVDESVALVLHVLHLDSELPPELWGARLTRRERSDVLRLVGRRVLERVPTAYLLGHAWFSGLRLRADPRALVPRSPIGEWIERGFTPWLDADEVGAVLDIGTGGGCIAIACAMAFPAARVDAVDVDLDALALAGENVRDHGLEERVRLIESDLFAGVDAAYDLIVCQSALRRSRRIRIPSRGVPLRAVCRPARGREGYRPDRANSRRCRRSLEEPGPSRGRSRLLPHSSGSALSPPSLHLARARTRRGERVCAAP